MQTKAKIKREKSVDMKDGTTNEIHSSLTVKYSEMPASFLPQTLACIINMKHYLIILFSIFIFGCGQTEQTENELDKTLEIDSLTTTNYDRHQFYGDLQYYPLDSLKSKISESDKVIAYNWNDNENNPANTQSYIVDAYGVYDKRIEKKIILNRQQFSTLSSLLIDTTNYNSDGLTGHYFISHIAFVFYYKDSVIGQSNISFFTFPAIKNVPKSKNEVFSLTGYNKFKAFCKSIGLNIIEKK